MSSIVTFYSYKGGVGRSMALANIGYELARRKRRVLMVDWDLEAPGLEKYFSTFPIDRSARGLLSLLLEYQRGANPDYTKYLWTIPMQKGQSLHLLHSGRDNDTLNYSKELGNFDWDRFFTEQKGGLHLERLRERWLKDYDLILIDSRTGLSDASGICTILLPDIIIPMFTANYQSLFGIRDVVNYILAARQKLAVDRMTPTILPVPARFGTRVEFKESQEWLDRIADILKDCFSDWLPKWIEPRYVLEQIKIPQVDFFSFGEKLAVVEQGTNDPESVGYNYARLADLLASDFSNIETFIGPAYFQQKKAEYLASRQGKPQQNKPGEFDYDLFIDAPRDAYQWVREVLLPALTEYLTDELGRQPRIFSGLSDVRAGENVHASLLNPLQRSKLLVTLLPRQDNSLFSDQEITHFISRQELTDNRLIFPVVYKKEKVIYKPNIDLNLPSPPDLSPFSREEMAKSTKLSGQFAMAIESLAKQIAQSLNTTSSPKKQDKQKEVRQLAVEYERLLDRMPSGKERTIVMENIFSKMKALVNDIRPELPTLMNSSSAGERLAAMAILQEYPGIDQVGWLADHVGDAEKPFVGYQASVALFIAARAFKNAHKSVLRQSIDKAMANVERSAYKHPNLIRNLNLAKAEVALKK